MSDVRFVTVSTRSRLAEAAVLAASLEAVHPGVGRLLFLAEREVRPSDRSCGWEVRPVAALPLPEPARFLFQYPAFELCCALKPYALEAGLAGGERGGAVYLDGDMLALAPFLDLVEAAWQDADVWLTPHLRTLKPSVSFPTLLQTGAYNAGFLAVRDGVDGRRFLRWFQERTARDCIQDFREGLFVDQKWLDLAAAVCPGVRPLRYPGINVGHWSLHEFTFEEQASGAILVDGKERVDLFHFSGLGERSLSRHSTLPVPAAIGRLAAGYREKREAQRVRFGAQEPYTLGLFADGATILPAHREAVRTGRCEAADPFSARDTVERDSVGAAPPARSGEAVFEADRQLRRLRVHPVIGRVWRFWKQWVNHELP